MFFFSPLPPQTTKLKMFLVQQAVSTHTSTPSQQFQRLIDTYSLELYFHVTEPCKSPPIPSKQQF